MICSSEQKMGFKGLCRFARGSRGSQLLELALALPMLVVLAVGGTDFSGAYNLKQKLNNAAREGARFGSAVATIDDTQTSCSNYSPAISAPCSVQGIQNVVLGYLANTKTQVDVCGMTTTTAPSSSGPPTWTYSSACGTSGNLTISINRQFVYVNSATGEVVPATQLVISHPYTWTIGGVIGLIAGSFPKTITIGSNAVMQNIPF